MTTTHQIQALMNPKNGGKIRRTPIIKTSRACTISKEFYCSVVRWERAAFFLKSA
jgi:hypothetical protein